MRPLIIGDAQKQQIATLRALASENVTDVETLKVAAAKDIQAYRQMMLEQSMEFPIGFLVTCTHERQPMIGVVQHISIAVETPHRTPHPAAVNMILDAFGMQSFDQSLSVWIEDVSPGEKAINVLQKLS